MLASQNFRGLIQGLDYPIGRLMLRNHVRITQVVSSENLLEAPSPGKLVGESTAHLVSQSQWSPLSFSQHSFTKGPTTEATP